MTESNQVQINFKIDSEVKDLLLKISKESGQKMTQKLIEMIQVFEHLNGMIDIVKKRIRSSDPQKIADYIDDCITFKKTKELEEEIKALRKKMQE